MAIHCKYVMFQAPTSLGVMHAGTPHKLGLASIADYKQAKYFFTTDGCSAPYMDPISFEAGNEQDILQVVTDLYREVVTGQKPVVVEGVETTLAAGPWGDAVQVVYVERKGKFQGQITQIMRPKFTLIAEAVDNAIIVKDASGQTFFVGGIRAADPGKGGPAFCGGFVDVKKDPQTGYEHADTTFETAVKEGRQETRFQFKVNPEDAGKLKDYSAREIRGTVEYVFKKKSAGETYPVRMQWIDTIETTNAPIAHGGEDLHEGKKRVHKTNLVVSTISTKGRDTVEKVRQMFHHENEESDLTGIVVVPLTGAFEENMAPEKVEAAVQKAFKAATEVNKEQLQNKEFKFGILHHNILFNKLIVHLHQDHVAHRGIFTRIRACFARIFSLMFFWRRAS